MCIVTLHSFVGILLYVTWQFVLCPVVGTFNSLLFSSAKKMRLTACPYQRN